MAAGAVVANHLALTAAGLWPRSHLLGPNWTRLPARGHPRRRVAITIDDGPDPEVTPRVLDLLEAQRARRPSSVSAERRAAPELAARSCGVATRIENHSCTIRTLLAAGAGRHAARNRSARRRRSPRSPARPPRFFRAPAGLRNPLLDPVLGTGLAPRELDAPRLRHRQRDRRWCSRELTRGLAAGDILLLHDGHAARTAAGAPVVLEVLPRTAAELRERPPWSRSPCAPTLPAA